MKRRTVRSVRNCLAMAMLLTIAQPTFAQEWVSVGSWNIEHFGKRDDGQHPVAIAQHIHLAAIDLLVLQEIYDTDERAESRTNGKLDDVVKTLNRQGGATWKYELLPKRHLDQTYQLLGVLWNDERLKKTGTLKLDVHFANDRTWNRAPYAVKFSTGTGKTDFVVIPLHMKSNVGGVEAAQTTRRQEALALAAALGQIGEHWSGEQDVILIGDTNCLHANEAALNVFDSAGFRDLNRGDAVTFRKGPYANPFDRILVPKRQGEFRYSNQYILAPTSNDQHLDRLSDHYLIKATIRSDPDDD